MLPGSTKRLSCWLLSVFALASTSTSAAASEASTIRRGLGPEPDSLHIHQAQGLAAINLLRDLREGLVTFDAAGELTPGQAVSWEKLDGGRRYRFSLNPRALWSNGEPVTAGDYVRAWRRAVSPQTTAATAGLLKDVVNALEILEGRQPVESLGIEAVAADVVEIRLRQPAPWILEILAHPVSFPLHAEDIEDARSALVNGPYRIIEWTPRASILLERNPHYHAAAAIRAERVEYLPIEDPASELARYRAGELHVTETIPAGRYRWLSENLPGDLRVHPYLGTFWLGLNFRHPALGDSLDLRRALALAIDRDILTKTVLGAGEVPAWSLVPPGMDGYTPAVIAEASMSQAEREALARRLYERSGHGRDRPLRLELRYNTSSIHRRMAVAVGAMWKQVLGVSAELVNEEWKVFVNNRRMGVVTEVFRGGWIADYADPTSFLDLFVSGSPLNTTFFSSTAYDQSITSAGLAAPGARLKVLRDAEATLMQDMPVIPLYYYVSRHLVRPEVAGFVDNVRDVHLSRYLEWETDRP